MGRLRDGEWIAGASGLVLLASLFGPWYGLRGLPVEVTAWQAFSVLDVVLALLALAPLVLVCLQATRRSPSLPVAFSVLTLVAGLLATVLVLYRLLNQPGPNDGVEVEPGAWLGLLAALGVFAGGWRSTRVEAIPGVPLPPIEHQPTPAA